jgi:hypothetical protein
LVEIWVEYGSVEIPCALENNLYHHVENVAEE